MRDFAAIDFETANNERSSVCSVGIVIVRDGEIVDSFYSLINPEPNYYNYWCSQVHGLTREGTDTAPIFPEVWKQIEPLIEGLPLVAHNRPFDESCLKAVFRVYQMDYPDYEFYDTLCVSRRVLPDLENHQLHTVAAACGYQLENHHHALADAEACAWIAREILECTISETMSTYSVKVKKDGRNGSTSISVGMEVNVVSNLSASNITATRDGQNAIVDAFKSKYGIDVMNFADGSGRANMYFEVKQL